MFECRPTQKNVWQPWPSASELPLPRPARHLPPGQPPVVSPLEPRHPPQPPVQHRHRQPEDSPSAPQPPPQLRGHRPRVRLRPPGGSDLALPLLLRRPVGLGSARRLRHRQLGVVSSAQLPHRRRPLAPVCLVPRPQLRRPAVEDCLARRRPHRHPRPLALALLLRHRLLPPLAPLPQQPQQAPPEPPRSSNI